MTTNVTARTPIITVTGFLGAGKTTLVNHLISDANGLRVVVFVNDFGEINIDHQLIETIEEDRISLKNGCVCCTLNEDLISSISQFVRQDEPPDAIVIEASGVANPVVLQSSITALEQAGIARSDCRICVIDAEQFNTLGYERTEQIIDGAVSSDIVLLNKADLASRQNRQSLRTTLEVSAPYATLIETTNCELPFNGLFYISENRMAENQTRSMETCTESFTQHSRHSESFRSWSQEIASPVDKKQFSGFVTDVMESAFRAKAIVYFTESPDTGHLFNLVGKRVSIEPLETHSANQLSSIVVIGTEAELDEDRIARSFLALLAN